MLIVFDIAVVLVLPAIGLLFTLAQRNLVEEIPQAIAAAALTRARRPAARSTS